MLPDRVSNPGPLTYESGVLPIALRGPAFTVDVKQQCNDNIVQTLIIVCFLALKELRNGIKI